ncbi:M1 family aminopeptidase [uncultured Paludibaculum sp.]|uniref:M1 family aminopeptidase n=1 Tax=uncultured Paludibaculum sp. TaxID=1765020 RepID=UPI002AAAEEC7|nr:M1 family aminopeptidase [uncultured Paludibaculum sp.]
MRLFDLLATACSTCVLLSAADPAALLTDYRAAREALPDAARVVTCEKVELRRPAVTITLESGKLAFLPPMAGRTYAAVFQGQGVFHFAAAAPAERAQTRRLSRKGEEVDDHFTELVLLFSDATEAEVLKQGKAAAGSVDSLIPTLKSARETFREQLHFNAEANVLRYLTRPSSSYCLALLKTKQFGTLLYEFAPADDEEVSLIRVKSSDSSELWNAFPLTDLGAKAGVAALPKQIVDTTQIDVDTVIAANASVAATATTKFDAVISGDQLVRISLASSLRVKEIKDQAGAALGFIQENEKRDGSLWVVAPAPLEAGKPYQWTFTYAGKDIIDKAGSGNFFVGARSSWFPRPTSPGEDFGDRAIFHTKFHIPKGFTLVGTGKEVRRAIEGKEEVTEWDSQRPATVSGFNYGKFSTKSLEANGFQVSVSANPGLTDELEELRMLLDNNPAAAAQLGISSGALNTTGMSTKAAAEAIQAMNLYTRIFGELPDKYLRVTQQPAGYFGQSWPGLVFLPYTSFLDGTARNQLKLDRGGMQSFLEEVGPHEISHQWWGHAVVWKNYRDQWLSEGFADYSAAIYIQATKGTKPFLNYLKHQHDHILVALGTPMVPNDAGPLSLGYRLGGPDCPAAGQLIYTKGAYVLHMIRMMMHDYETGSDARFFTLMRDFVKSFPDKPASTADFQTLLSKHMGTDMSWFINQWVYNSAVPKIKGQYSIVQEGGKPVLVVEPQITGVPDGFRMELPLAMKFKSGTRVGRFRFIAPGAAVKATLPEVPESIEFNPTLELLGDVDLKKK